MRLFNEFNIDAEENLKNINLHIDLFEMQDPVLVAITIFKVVKTGEPDALPFFDKYGVYNYFKKWLYIPAKNLNGIYKINIKMKDGTKTKDIFYINPSSHDDSFDNIFYRILSKSFK